MSSYIVHPASVCASGVCHGPPGPLVPQRRFTDYPHLLTTGGCTSCGDDSKPGRGFLWLALGISALFLLGD